MNHTERCQWVDNDEGLYQWMCMSGMTKHKFIRANSNEIDRIIEEMVSGKKRRHYLVYG